MNTLIRAAALVAALCAGTATQAAASTITFDYSSKCANSVLGSCGTIGLANHAAVSGTISFDSADILPNAVLDQTDITGFNLSFGTVKITLSSAVALGLSATVNAAGTGFSAFSLSTSEKLDPGATGVPQGDSIVITLNSWTASLTGNCQTTTCSGGVILGSEAVVVSNNVTPGYGVASFTKEQTTSTVPEPASAALLAAAMLVLAWWRRPPALARIRA